MSGDSNGFGVIIRLGKSSFQHKKEKEQTRKAKIAIQRQKSLLLLVFHFRHRCCCCDCASAAETSYTVISFFTTIRAIRASVKCRLYCDFERYPGHPQRQSSQLSASLSNQHGIGIGDSARCIFECSVILHSQRSHANPFDANAGGLSQEFATLVYESFRQYEKSRRRITITPIHHFQRDCGQCNAEPERCRRPSWNYPAVSLPFGRDH